MIVKGLSFFKVVRACKQKLQTEVIFIRTLAGQRELKWEKQTWTIQGRLRYLRVVASGKFSIHNGDKIPSASNVLEIAVKKSVGTVHYTFQIRQLIG